MPNPRDLHSEDAVAPLKARAVFGGLVFNQDGEAAKVVAIGGVDHYAVPDEGFVYHIEACQIDDIVLAEFQRQLSEAHPQLVDMMLELLGRRDIFTKAALDSSIENLADNIRRSDTSQWTTMLGLAGFRIVVDRHGEIIEIVFPSQPDDEGD